MSNQPDDPAHGAARLAAVTVDCYNAELHDETGGFLGDRASSRAFQAMLEDWRERLRPLGESGASSDPLARATGGHYDRGHLNSVLAEGDPEAAGVIMGTLEDFAQEIATTTRRFLRMDGWTGTERIAVGGGFRDGRLGELAIGRASVLLRVGGAVRLTPMRHHPDEAGLIGAVHLMPPALLDAGEAILAVDIGGTKVRAGVVLTERGSAADLSRAEVWQSKLWCHRDDPDATRDGAVATLVGLLRDLLTEARAAGVGMAPFIGIGCPGLIDRDGTVIRGGQNLPGGDWEAQGFNLVRALREALPELGGRPTRICLHNDAVVQGLSEVPFMRDVERWGALTVGTGLGNARFTNR
ncbi:ROK family protein [uncultured Methylobacterium sp.]|uniref:ROK family protein n=1 Tax=uncultured Methylobacterium sp. TaxID=157278 RepID=UPI0035C99E56